MKNFVLSLFLLPLVTLPMVNSSAQDASIPPGGVVYILDRVDVEFYADGTYITTDVCTYGPGFCGL